MSMDRGKTIQRLSDNSVGSVDITGDPRVKAMAECLLFVAQNMDDPLTVNLKTGTPRPLSRWIREVLEGAGYEVKT